MATTIDYIDYVKTRLKNIEEDLVFKKMFGEYGYYYKGIFIGTVEDNNIYLKITEAAKTFLGDFKIVSPRKGASFIEVPIEDEIDFKTLFEITANNLSKKTNR